MDQGPLEYHWLHIPSKQSGYAAFGAHFYMEGVTKFLTLCDKLKAVNEWNNKQPGTWQYWL